MKFWHHLAASHPKTGQIHAIVSKWEEQRTVELAWRSGSVMDCHATARGLIPGRDSVKTELHVFPKGQ